MYNSFSRNNPYSTKELNQGFSLSRRESQEKRSLTYEILYLFSQKLTNPGLYNNYELTLKQFNSSLDFFERRISDSIYKVTKKVNLEDEDIPENIEDKVKLQYEYCIDGGELFLEAIDEMRYYIDHADKVGDLGDPEHGKECDWEAGEHLEEGLDIAKDADEKIRKSLTIFDELYEEDY